MPRGDFWPHWTERLAKGARETGGGCHEWTGSRNSKGYGVIHLRLLTNSENIRRAYPCDEATEAKRAKQRAASARYRARLAARKEADRVV